jgi:hypothetical protein
MHLSWRRTKDAPICFVGEFDLDLNELLTNKFVRWENEKAGAIRLRFYHGSDDVIHIQINLKNPGLPIGKIISR